MLWLYALIVAGVSAGIIFLSVPIIKRLSTGGSSGAKEHMLEEIEALNVQIEKALAATANFLSAGQAKAIGDQLKEVQTQLDAQKKLLADVEKKLGDAQKAIEEKEAYHQNMKTARADDQEKLTNILARFEDIAAESISLEQKIAQSMKSLDQMMVELSLTKDQIVIFQDLQAALTDSSAQLRELYIEYDNLKKRIDTITTQLDDLEGEYTKLVEQQLGE